LSFDLGIAQQADNRMDVIGHHHKVAHVVAISVKVQQSISDDLAQLRTTQDAGSQPFVERFHVLAGKRVVKVAAQRDIKPVKLVPPVSISHRDPVALKPVGSLCVPTPAHFHGHRVFRPERHELRDSLLIPMRQTGPHFNPHIGVWIE
jgi:hypothetical protein